LGKVVLECLGGGYNDLDLEIEKFLD